MHTLYKDIEETSVHTKSLFQERSVLPPGNSKGRGNLKVVRNSPLFNIGDIDFSVRMASAKQIEQANPHRFSMALLDWIVWENAEKTRGVALKEVRDDEFWTAGHFPGNPILPGVLMVEAGAQLACYLVSSRSLSNAMPIFMRIEKASFRSMLKPGDNLHILSQEVKNGRRCFVFDIQGWSNDKIAFESRIIGSYKKISAC